MIMLIMVLILGAKLTFFFFFDILVTEEWAEEKWYFEKWPDL